MLSNDYSYNLDKPFLDNRIVLIFGLIYLSHSSENRAYFSLYFLLLWIRFFYLELRGGTYDSDQFSVRDIACFIMLHGRNALKIRDESRTSKIRKSIAIVGYRTDNWCICDKYTLVIRLYMIFYYYYICKIKEVIRLPRFGTSWSIQQSRCI